MVEGINEKEAEKLAKEVTEINTKRIIELQNKKELSKDEEYELENLKRTTPLYLLREAFYTINKTILPYYLDDTPENFHIVTLWIIGSYFHKQFNSYPYLFFNAMRGSGKSRYLRLIAELGGGKWTSSVTESVIFRTIGLLCIDEIENINSKEKEPLRELLNASYKKGLTIMRMKKVKKQGEEGQQVEEFECYRPICMANINGMEEVLGDRCLSLILEKSDNLNKICKIENFEKNFLIQKIKQNLKECSYVVKCSKKNTENKWNQYVNYILYTTTLTTHNTHTTQNNDINVVSVVNVDNKDKVKSIDINNTNDTNDTKPLDDFLYTIEEDEYTFFEKIGKTGIKGRNLELFFPLFQIANILGEDIFNKTLEIAKKMDHDKRDNELNESTDIQVYKFIANLDNNLEHKKIIDLTNDFRLYSGIAEEWTNPKWFGRVLKRLNLILDKKRKSHGIEVLLDINKAIDKAKMFEYGLKDN